MAPAMLVPCCKYTTSVDIQKCTIKASHSYRITCEHSESAQEQRIVLYKSDQQQHSNFEYLRKWLQHCLVVTWLVPYESMKIG